MISLLYTWKELWASRTRLLLTVFAIAWGTVSISGMLAVGEGLRHTFGTAMSSVGKNLLIVSGGKTSEAYRGIKKSYVVYLTEEDLQRLRYSLRQLATVIPENTIEAQLHYGNKKTFTSPRAVTPDYSTVRDIEIETGGRFINDLDMKNFSHVIVLGNSVKDDLFGSDPPVIGKTVILGDWPFTVVGVMKKKLQIGGYGVPDEYQAWIPLTTFQLLSHQRNYSNFIITQKDPKTIDDIKNRIKKVIAYNHLINPNDRQILSFEDMREEADKVNHFLLGMQVFLGIIGCITLIVASVGIANVMMISVNRATRDIGIQMALGARRYHILLHYIVESLLVSALGGVVGIVLVKMLIALSVFVPINANFIKMVGRPYPLLSMNVVWIVMIVLGIVGGLSGFFPAYKAASINPVEALRHD